jgi:DNA-binding NarL/FixJ family response regulator
MLVDDHPTFRDGLSRLLQEAEGFEILATADSGQQAIELARDLKPEVVVMDISMPDMNGIEAARQIKSANPQTNILMVSAFNYPSYALVAVGAGASGYLLKNAPLPEVIESIRLVAEGRAVFNLKVAGKLFRSLADDKSKDSRQFEGLSSRELEILSLVAKGNTNKEIALKLYIDEGTVQTHLVNIFRKLEVNTRTEAVIQGLKQGWLSLEDLPDYHLDSL